jgi:5S rRNA maturation endonuclease (ribonuclease M5)
VHTKHFGINYVSFAPTTYVSFAPIVSKYLSGVWGSIPTVKLPSAIFKDRVLTLDGAALAVLVVLHQKYVGQSAHIRKMAGTRNSQQETYNPVAKVDHAELIKLTGFGDRKITYAVKELRLAGFIEIGHRSKGGKKGGHGPGRYELRVLDRTLRNVKGCMLFENTEMFFCVPEAVVTHREQYAMARMEGSEWRLYVAACWLATLEQAPGRQRAARAGATFKMKGLDMRKAAKLSLPTYKKALAGLESKKLILTFPNPDQSKDLLTVMMCDPYTTSPVHVHREGNPDQDNPANYYTTDAKGVTRRLNINKGMTPEARERILRASLDGGPMTKQGNGDFKIRCPFPSHADRTPSCSVSTIKGCFHCYGCKMQGSFLDLLKALNKGSEYMALLQMTDATGQPPPEFHDPDHKLKAIYSYWDKYGHELKQVVRKQDDENGNKVFLQRRRKPNGGWEWNVKGLPPMLFNGHLLGQGEDLVVVCEGEKDAVAITNAKSRDTESAIRKATRLASRVYYPPPDSERTILGVTSGPANSWKPELAELLKDSKVILFPDNDAAGAVYAEAVCSSLDALEIEYVLVTTDCKDASEFMEHHGGDELRKLLISQWENRPKWLPIEPPIEPIEGEITI